MKGGLIIETGKKMRCYSQDWLYLLCSFNLIFPLFWAEHWGLRFLSRDPNRGCAFVQFWGNDIRGNTQHRSHRSPFSPAVNGGGSCRQADLSPRQGVWIPAPGAKTKTKLGLFQCLSQRIWTSNIKLIRNKNK